MLETIITHECGGCGSEELVKNGHDYKGAQKYHCKACGRYGTLNAQRGYGITVRQQVERAILERVSLRGIERIFGVSWRTVARWLEGWVKAVGKVADTLAPAQVDDILELDEAWSFVANKGRKRWVWVALCRRTRQIVAYFIGDRSTASCRKLWQRIPTAYVRCQSYSDFWHAYGAVFDLKRHQSVGKASGQTNHVERFFNTLCVYR